MERKNSDMSKQKNNEQIFNPFLGLTAALNLFQELSWSYMLVLQSYIAKVGSIIRGVLEVWRNSVSITAICTRSERRFCVLSHYKIPSYSVT